MRPIQYSSNTPFLDHGHAPSRSWWLPRMASGMVSAVIVSVGTFTIFWMIAMLTALLMVRG